MKVMRIQAGLQAETARVLFPWDVTNDVQVSRGSYQRNAAESKRVREYQCENWTKAFGAQIDSVYALL